MRLRKLHRNNHRPEGYAYGDQRQHPSHAPSQRAGRTGCSGVKAMCAKLLGHIRAFTPLGVTALCAAALLCVAVPVALALGMGGGARPAAQGNAGFVWASAGTATDGSSPEPTPSPDPTPTPPVDPSNTILRVGVTAPVVAEIQQRLMKLGYMDEDEPTDYFGPVTSSAVALFQRQHAISVDGTVGMETYSLLMGDGAQNYTVMEGAAGEDVKDLQTRLRQLGYLEKVTGTFSELTTKAVKSLQQYNDLSPDGKVGRKTLELLYSDKVKPYFMKYGEQSDKVKACQKRLNTLGYLTTTPDGKYGRDTVAAVRRFQEVNGLIADGFLGPDTVDLLVSRKAHANALVLGMRGNDVKEAQNRLKALGYLRHVTGYFGSETEDAVKAFQKRNGLSADGTVGRQTMNKLNSGNAKKAASGSSGSSGSASSGSSGSKTGVEKLISIAESKLGKKYVWGAKGPNTFDCSGFVYYCLNAAGVRQGYLTSEGWAGSGKYQKITSIGDVKRGDILVFSGSSAGHVGIYLGNGGMIDASSANGKVVKRSGIWNGSYWKSKFICAFRVY